MKAVLLAGGLGTGFSEETDVKPKPMIEVGGMPYSGRHRRKNHDRRAIKRSVNWVASAASA